MLIHQKHVIGMLVRSLIAPTSPGRSLRRTKGMSGTTEQEDLSLDSMTMPWYIRAWPRSEPRPSSYLPAGPPRI